MQKQTSPARQSPGRNARPRRLDRCASRRAPRRRRRDRLSARHSRSSGLARHARRRQEDVRDAFCPVRPRHCRRSTAKLPKRDALPDGQHPSALLGLVHGGEQLHRSARRLFGRDPGLQPWRRQPRRRQDGRTGRRLVQGDDRLSGLGEWHAGQRRIDGQHHRLDRCAQRQGRRRRA